jgi:thioesterase domain-containing protein
MKKDNLEQQKAELAERRSRLSGAQRARLEQRLRGKVEQKDGGSRQPREAISSHVSLVPIQEGHAGKRPLFFVHPVGGGVFCYNALASHLEPGQPFYGLQARGLDSEQAPLTQIEAMAGHYVELVQTVQPEGPYLLGGWSLGGVIVFEMAQQLSALSHKTALLVLIDSAIPVREQKTTADQAMLLGRFALDLGLPLDLLLAQLNRLDQRTHDEWLAYVLEQARRAGLVPADMELPRMRRLFHVFESNTQALKQYVPHAYSGPVTLFQAGEAGAESPAGDLGWGELVSADLTIHTIPGNHYTIMREPHVQALAGELGRLLHAVTK